MKYAVRHTIPVWVYVEDGKVTAVHADDGALSDPLGYVSKEDLDLGWVDEDVRPWRGGSAVAEDYAQSSGSDWPGWEWGW